MTLTLTVCEKSPGGPAAQEYSIELQEERLTVRELIRNIVFQQVYNQNTKLRESGQEWDRVSGKETKPAPEKTIDWVPKFEHALVAFENNQVLLLVDEMQLEDLNSFVTVKPTSKITFLKLIPLIGG
jgi:hypothetical protein